MISERKEDIKFSILVPVYQVEAYVEECIQSVLDQTYENWELILVDDGSKDKSGEICDRYAEKDDRIHVYHKENRGLIHTRRYAIARMTGDYCVFLDSDDTLKLKALEVIYDAIQKYRCDCLIYGFERLLKGKVVGKSGVEEECCITDKREIYKKCCMGGYGFLWRKAVKTSVFKGVDYSPYYHIQLLEDELQSLEILEGSNSVGFIDDRLYNYRINPNSITQTIKMKDEMDSFIIRMKILDFFKTQNVFKEEDYIDYGTNCLIIFCANAVAIGASADSFQNKLKNIQRIKKDELYRTVINTGMYDIKKTGIKTKVVWALLSKNRYRLLFLMSALYRNVFQASLKK